MAKKKAETPPEGDGDDGADKAVAAFGRKFVKDVPAAAATGLWSPTSRDAFGQADIAAPDGVYGFAGWFFRIRDRRLVDAIAVDRANRDLVPEKIRTVKA